MNRLLRGLNSTMIVMLIFRKNFYFISLLLILILICGCTATKHPQSSNKPSNEPCINRTGFFTIRGQLIDNNGKPIYLPRQAVHVCFEKGNTWNIEFYKNPETKKWAIKPGSGDMDENGIFEIKVDKKYFCKEKIRFILKINPNYWVTDKNNEKIIFVVGETVDFFDLGKIAFDSSKSIK